MDFKNIILERQGRIATITLNRPEKLNALSEALMAELDIALDGLDDDRAIRVVIIKGAGRAFSAGYDVNPETPERKGGKADIGADRLRLNKNVKRWLKIWDLSKPVIAQVHGYCIAGGSQLASLCDLTFVAEDTMLGFPQLGPLGGAMIAAEWCHLVGPKKTKELFYNIGKLIDGKEAVRIGWANAAFPAEKLAEEVNTIAQQISETPLEILEINKAHINRYVEMSGLRTAMLYGAEMDAIGHFTKPVQQFLKMIEERGMKQASQDWRKEID